MGPIMDGGTDSTVVGAGERASWEPPTHRFSTPSRASSSAVGQVVRVFAEL